MTQSIEEQIGTLPAIKPEGHFVQVGLEMLRANVMPSAHDAALEKRESGFDCVGVDIPVHIAPLAVVDGLVILDTRFPHGDGVSRGIIGEHDFHILADILSDEFRQRTRLCIFGVEEPEIAVALANAHNYVLVVPTSGLSLIAVFPANVSHIHFNLSVQHRFVGLGHCMTDAVTQIPRCFVSADPEGALNLASGHALLRFTEQERCGEPFHKGQVGIIEHGSGCNRKLVVAIFAVEELLVSFQFDYIPVAAQAARAFREAQADKKFAALGIGWEHGVDVN